MEIQKRIKVPSYKEEEFPSHCNNEDRNSCSNSLNTSSSSSALLLEQALHVACLHCLEEHLDTVSIYMMSLVESSESTERAFKRASHFLMSERMRKAHISIVAPPSLRLPRVTRHVSETSVDALPLPPSSSLVLMDGNLYRMTKHEKKSQYNFGSTQKCEVKLRHNLGSDERERECPLFSPEDEHYWNATNATYSAAPEYGLLDWEGYRYDINQEKTFTDTTPLCIYWHPSPQDGILFGNEEESFSGKSMNSRLFENSTHGVAVLLGVVCMNHLVDVFRNNIDDENEEYREPSESDSPSNDVDKIHSASSWCDGCPSCSCLRRGKANSGNFGDRTAYSTPGTLPRVELQCRLLSDHPDRLSPLAEQHSSANEIEESWAASKGDFICRYAKRKCQITSLTVPFSSLLHARASQVAGRLQRDLSIMQYCADTGLGNWLCSTPEPERSSTSRSRIDEQPSSSLKETKSFREHMENRQSYLRAILQILSQKEQKLLQKPSFNNFFQQIVSSD